MQTEFRSEKRLSVLVVDDDGTIRKLLKPNLEDKSTRVFEAATGFDCIRILQEAKIDLVILDLGLPDFNGWGVLSLIRLTDSLHDTPVVIVSAEPPDRALMKLLRPDDYIQKPFDMSNLLVRVKKAVEPKGFIPAE